MKKRNLTQVAILCALLISSVNIYSQVTIGSGEKPVKGAILDLKEYDAATAGGVTASKGMLLPRVKLTDINNLYPMFLGNEPDYANQKETHTGLWVYNISGNPLPQCAPIPDGVYIWDGISWQAINKINDPDLPTLGISGAHIYFPSGQDARLMPTTPETFTVNWTPADIPLIYTNTPHSTWGGISFNGTNTPPANGNFTSSQTFSLLPDAMTAAEVASNPFRIKQNELKFIAKNECGKDITEIRLINQLNYAIKANNSIADTNIKVTNATQSNFNVESNVIWKPVITGTAFTTTPANNTATGSENNQGGSSNTTFYYQANANNKFETSTVTFTDNAATARAKPITVSLLSCVGTASPANASKEAAVNFNPNVTTIEVPSGSDERGTSTAFNYTVNWGGNSLAIKPVEQSGSDWTAGMFTSSPWGASGSTQTSSTTPLTYAATANKLNPPSAASPWASREWQVTYDATDNCDGLVSKTITINQTNYAIEANNSLADTNIKVTNLTQDSFSVRSNVQWKPVVVGTATAFTFTPFANTITGNDNNQGGITSSDFYYTASANSKYETVTVTFTDNAAIARAKPITVSLLSCAGTPSVANASKEAAVNFSPATTRIDLPSGRDARTMPTTPEKLEISWTPSNKPLAYSNTASATLGGISFNAAGTPPANGVLNTSPTTFNFLANAMNATDVASNPFLSKENELIFTAEDECGDTTTQKFIINQTNKALLLAIPRKEYTANQLNETNTVTTNADFKVSYLPANATNAISNVKLDGTPLSIPSSVSGFEQNNGKGKVGNLTYDVTAQASKARYSFVIFSDTKTPKRFLDVSMTVIQCNNDSQQPTIDEWAEIAGFTKEQINKVKTTGVDSDILSNGIQMHRVKQSIRGANQIFLSSNFGTNPLGSDERWMIHNLDATAYDGVGPTLTGPTATNSNTVAYWGYPNGGTNAATTTTYNQNPRLGLLYNWPAATAGKTSVIDESGSGANAFHPTVQGICPAGWHLPSDYEWDRFTTDAYIANGAEFSSSSDPITTANVGSAMQEACQQYNTQHVGTSNTISSTVRPGFDAFLAGYADTGTANVYGVYGYFWSASGYNTSNAWYRLVYGGSSRVTRGNTYRLRLFSVRCKKD